MIYNKIKAVTKHKDLLSVKSLKSPQLVTALLYCIVLYCIALYCIVLYCIVLYCIVLYCIIAPTHPMNESLLSSYYEISYQRKLLPKTILAYEILSLLPRL